jgi:hypothetical protein
MLMLLCDCYIVDGENKANLGLYDCITYVVVNDGYGYCI